LVRGQLGADGIDDPQLVGDLAARVSHRPGDRLEVVALDDDATGVGGGFLPRQRQSQDRCGDDRETR